MFALGQFWKKNLGAFLVSCTRAHSCIYLSRSTDIGHGQLSLPLAQGPSECLSQHLSGPHSSPCSCTIPAGTHTYHSLLFLHHQLSASNLGVSSIIVQSFLHLLTVQVGKRGRRAAAVSPLRSHSQLPTSLGTSLGTWAPSGRLLSRLG